MSDGAQELVLDFSIKHVFRLLVRSFCLCSFCIWACASSSRVVSRNLANLSTLLYFSSHIIQQLILFWSQIAHCFMWIWIHCFSDVRNSNFKSPRGETCPQRLLTVQQMTTTEINVSRGKAVSAILIQEYLVTGRKLGRGGPRWQIRSSLDSSMATSRKSEKGPQQCISLNLGLAAGQHQAYTTVLQWARIETSPVVLPRLATIHGFYLPLHQ